MVLFVAAQQGPPEFVYFETAACEGAAPVQLEGRFLWRSISCATVLRRRPRRRGSCASLLLRRLRFRDDRRRPVLAHHAHGELVPVRQHPPRVCVRLRCARSFRTQRQHPVLPDAHPVCALAGANPSRFLSNQQCIPLARRRSNQPFAEALQHSAAYAGIARPLSTVSLQDTAICVSVRREEVSWLAENRTLRAS